jgi:hypothetical protein
MPSLVLLLLGAIVVLAVAHGAPSPSPTTATPSPAALNPAHVAIALPVAVTLCVAGLVLAGVLYCCCCRGRRDSYASSSSCCCSSREAGYGALEVGARLLGAH